MLDGPKLEAAAGSADALVVLLHGYGANGEDLIALGHEWRQMLPRAAFVAPNAPEALPMSGMGGLQWFALTMRDPSEYWRGASAAGPSLTAFLQAELQRRRLSPGRLALVGFSQGTMMALQVGLRLDPPLSAIVGYSGMLAGPEHLEPASAQPAIMLVHGEADDVIPVQALDVTREALASRGFAVEWHRRPGLGHGIDPVGLRLGGHFLAQALQQS
jgi:phospholipase/carboxylesterase